MARLKKLFDRLGGNPAWGAPHPPERDVELDRPKDVEAAEAEGYTVQAHSKRRFSFVEFSTEEEARTALDAINHRAQQLRRA